MQLSAWPSAVHPWPVVRDLALHAESRGYHGVWVMDHFMDNTAQGGGHVLEGFSVLAALAAVVPRVRLGSLVAGNLYRHPAVLANQAATIDVISDGRFVLGLGAGWQENEHAQYGIDLLTTGARLRRFEEACEVIRALRDERVATFDGEHYRLRDAGMDPKPVGPMPLLIGGAGEKVMPGIVARRPSARFYIVGMQPTPAVLALRANPPEMIATMMLPPAAYILMNQLYEQGVAPSAKTWFYDGAGIADYPDFWQNVKDAGKYMLNFGLYHPQMDIPPIGKEMAAEYTKRTKNEPNRLVFQAADSLLLIAEAIKQAKSTDPKAITKALQAIKFSGVRGPFTFGQEPGIGYHQWVDIPYVAFQLTEVNQPVSKSNLIQGPGQKLDVKKLQKPK